VQVTVERFKNDACPRRVESCTPAGVSPVRAVERRGCSARIAQFSFLIRDLMRSDADPSSCRSSPTVALGQYIVMLPREFNNRLSWSARMMNNRVTTWQLPRVSSDPCARSHRAAFPIPEHVRLMHGVPEGHTGRQPLERQVPRRFVSPAAPRQSLPAGAPHAAGNTHPRCRRRRLL